MAQISVLMPCRDAAADLPAAIASLEAQTFIDFQVLAVDDGSRDATPDHLAAWASRDPRVRVLRPVRRGIVSALNAGIAAAAAPIIARMDADDIAEPDRLRRQLELLAERPDVVACGTGVRYFPDDTVKDGARRYEHWLNGLVEPDHIDRDIFVECPIAHPTLMIRRDTLLSVGGYRDMGWPEDYDLVLRLWAAGLPMANVPAVLHRWRERPDRASRTDSRYAANAFRRCKVHFLRLGPLAARDGAVVWGAGPVGKHFARELRRQDVRLRAFVDIDPRKIGQDVYGVPVIAPHDVARFRAAFVLAAVGSPTARAEIRATLDALGWTEREEYRAVA